MNIIEVSSECSGLAQRGGLGSVIWGISDAFRKMAYRPTIVLPYYAEIGHEVHRATTLSIYYGGVEQSVSVFEANHFGIRVFLIHSDRFFRGEYADVYIDSSKLSRGYFEDDAKRFAFFSLAVCHLLLELQNNENIDAIHCHDWHTGLVSLLIREHPAFYRLREIPRIFTIHNLEYQGTRPFAAFGNLQGFLDWFPDLAHVDLAEFTQYLDPHADIPCINPMRAGIHASDRITTVSPSYAEEICQPDNPQEGFLGGRGLEADLAALYAKGRLVGITNGIDQEFYDPQKRHLPYTHKNRMKGRNANRLYFFREMDSIIENLVMRGALVEHSEVALREKLRAIRQQEFLREPLFVSVARLTGQKIRLFLEEFEGKNFFSYFAELPCYLVFLGKGDLLRTLAEASAQAPNVLLFGGFDDDLEKLLYAAADALLMPSEFEPCGTSQMKAMRYGCLPIAAAVGGLKDTIENGHNGFLFTGTSRQERQRAFLTSIENALEILQKNHKSWLRLQKNAMQTDFSWTHAAQQYSELMQR